MPGEFLKMYDGTSLNIYLIFVQTQKATPTLIQSVKIEKV